MRMPITEETRAALALLKDVRAKVAASEASDLKVNSAVNNDLGTLISVLESPVFQSILNIQDSLRELKRQVRKQCQKKTICNMFVTSQVHLHPSILPADFDITPTGELVLNLPPSPTSSASTTASGYPNGLNGSVQQADAKLKASAAAPLNTNVNLNEARVSNTDLTHAMTCMMAVLNSRKQKYNRESSPFNLKQLYS